MLIEMWAVVLLLISMGAAACGALLYSIRVQQRCEFLRDENERLKVALIRRRQKECVEVADEFYKGAGK